MTNQSSFFDKDFLSKLNLFLLIACLLFLFYILIVEIHLPCGKCTSQPFIYGAKVLEEQNGEEVIGKIQFKTIEPSSVIYFDSQKSWIEHPSNQNIYNSDINLSNIFVS